jgi:hypothetical protein
MIDKIKELFQEILNELRDTSYNHSPERLEFAKLRLGHHREFMRNERRWSPYLHEDEWDKHR